MKFKRLTEKRWELTIPTNLAMALRKAINVDEDNAAIIDAIEAIYEYIHTQNSEIVDDSDLDSYKEELNDLRDSIADGSDVDEYIEDNIDYQLTQLYDLCDNCNIWILINEECEEEKAAKLNEDKDDDITRLIAMLSLAKIDVVCIIPIGSDSFAIKFKKAEDVTAAEAALGDYGFNLKATDTCAAVISKDLAEGANCAGCEDKKVLTEDTTEELKARVKEVLSERLATEFEDALALQVHLVVDGYKPAFAADESRHEYIAARDLFLDATVENLFANSNMGEALTEGKDGSCGACKSTQKTDAAKTQKKALKEDAEEEVEEEPQEETEKSADAKEAAKTILNDVHKTCDKLADEFGLKVDEDDKDLDDDVSNLTITPMKEGEQLFNGSKAEVDKQRVECKQTPVSSKPAQKKEELKENVIDDETGDISIDDDVNFSIV